jgi:hypothetical protein
MPDDDKGNPVIQPTARDLIEGLVTQFRQVLGSTEECAAVLKSHVPDWNGKIQSLADIKKLSDKLEDKFAVGDKVELPDDVSKALMGLIAGRYGATVATEVTDRFGELNVAQAAIKLWQVFATSVDAKRKGGKTRAKVTPEVKQLAREIFANEKNANVSDHAAYRRTSAKLKSQHDISISAKTLKRHLEADETDNA